MTKPVLLLQRSITMRSALARPTPRLIPRRTPQARRHISIFSWRRPKEPIGDLPRYFPKTRLSPKQFMDKISRFGFKVIVLYTCWQFFTGKSINPVADWATEKYDKASAEEKKEIDAMVEENSDGIFLPFPFLVQSVTEPMYRGSDPEWKTYVAVNKDKKLQKQIRMGMADMIRRGVEKNPGLVKVLGGGEIKVKKYWLDIIYPPRPPPKQYISGIVIDGWGLSWGERPIDSYNANILDSAVHPKAVALSAWSFVNVLVSKTYQDISQFLGLASQPPVETSWQSEALKKMETAGFHPVLGTKSTSGKRDATQNSPLASSGQAQESNLLGIGAEGDLTLDPRLTAAAQAALVTFTKNWKAAKKPPTKGCLRVDGMVELKGKSALLAVYVFGWYDPGTKTYVGVQTGLKHLVAINQRPAP